MDRACALIAERGEEPVVGRETWEDRAEAFLTMCGFLKREEDDGWWGRIEPDGDATLVRTHRALELIHQGELTAAGFGSTAAYEAGRLLSEWRAEQPEEVPEEHAGPERSGEWSDGDVRFSWDKDEDLQVNLSHDNESYILGEDIEAFAVWLLGFFPDLADETVREDHRRALAARARIETLLARATDEARHLRARAETAERVRLADLQRHENVLRNVRAGQARDDEEWKELELELEARVAELEALLAEARSERDALQSQVERLIGERDAAEKGRAYYSEQLARAHGEVGTDAEARKSVEPLLRESPSIFEDWAAFVAKVRGDYEAVSRRWEAYVSRVGIEDQQVAAVRAQDGDAETILEAAGWGKGNYQGEADGEVWSYPDEGRWSAPFTLTDALRRLAESGEAHSGEWEKNERLRAEADAVLYGTGYLVEQRRRNPTVGGAEEVLWLRVAPEKVRVFLRSAEGELNERERSS